WVKGFLQIQAVMRRAQPVFELNRTAARALINSIKANTKETIYIIPRANQPQLVLCQPARGEIYIAITGAHRLRLLQKTIADIQTLHAYQVTETGATIWVANTGSGQMTLALAGKVEYGFSGDGEALRSFSNEPEDTAVWLARTTIAQLNNFTVEQFCTCE